MTDDDWTRRKKGESIDVLARDRGCTRERMRHRLNKLDERPKSAFAAAGSSPPDQCPG